MPAIPSSDHLKCVRYLYFHANLPFSGKTVLIYKDNFIMRFVTQISLHWIISLLKTKYEESHVEHPDRNYILI